MGYTSAEAAQKHRDVRWTKLERYAEKLRKRGYVIERPDSEPRRPKQ
jgi:hypothetical protein